jgi:hypothetical protein
VAVDEDESPGLVRVFVCHGLVGKALFRRVAPAQVLVTALHGVLNRGCSIDIPDQQADLYR